MIEVSKYGILTRDVFNGRAFFEIGRSFDTLGQAEDYILGDTDDSHFCIVEIDLLAGAVKTVVTSDQIKKMIGRKAKAELHAEQEDAVYGSYAQQHALRLCDVVKGV